MKWMTDQVSQKRIEEVSMKWIDRQIAKKGKCHWNWSNFIRYILQAHLHLIYFSGISMFLHFSVYPFQSHVLFPFLWHLVCPSVSQALPLYVCKLGAHTNKLYCLNVPKTGNIGMFGPKPYLIGWFKTCYLIESLIWSWNISFENCLAFRAVHFSQKTWQPLRRHAGDQNN